jgi:hypothetical protein
MRPARRFLPLSIAALLATLLFGCRLFGSWERSLYGSVESVARRDGVVFEMQRDRPTAELSVYEVSSLGRTISRRWRIGAREPKRLREIRYGVVPEGYAQGIPEGPGPPRPLGPGRYAAVTLATPLGFRDYYYFRIEEDGRIVKWENVPGGFRGVAVSEDGAP